MTSTLLRFLRWWLHELASLLPHRESDRTQARLHTLVVRGEGAQLTLARRTRRGEVSLARLDTRGPHAGLPPRPRDLVPARSQVLVELPRGQVLEKPVQLPRAAAENLREVLRYEMERLTPFRVEEVLYDAEVLDPGGRGELMRVMLRVLPRRLVADLPELLRDWHFDLAADRVRLRPGPTGHDLVFLPPVPADAHRVFLAWLLWPLNAALLAAVVGYPFWQQHQQLQALAAAEREARAEAQASAELRARIDALQADLDLLAALRLEQPPVVELLEEVSRLLPDSTSLERLESRNQELYLQGSSASATALIPRLEDSPLLADVRFRSPVTRVEGPGAGEERFHLAARIVSPFSSEAPR